MSTKFTVDTVRMYIHELLSRAKAPAPSGTNIVDKMRELAEIKSGVEGITDALKAAEKRMDALRADIKEFIREEGEQVSFGYKFEIRRSQRTSVASWLVDRIKAGETIPGITLNEQESLFVTKSEEG